MEIFESLRRDDQRLLQNMADDAGVSVQTMMPAVIGAYLRMVKDVPDALPSDPLRGLIARGKRGRSNG